MLNYVETHPWWTLVYLLVTCVTLVCSLEAIRRK